MNSYNGYTPAQRYKALSWFKKQIKEGKKPSHPHQCDFCGQNNGVIAWHSEDYSEPYGDHIGKYGVCYVCHMMIHCRFKNKQLWLNYTQKISQSFQTQPFHFNDWKTFKEKFLINKMEDVIFVESVFKNSELFDLLVDS